MAQRAWTRRSMRPERALLRNEPTFPPPEKGEISKQSHFIRYLHPAFQVAGRVSATRIPNLVARGLYVERLRAGWLPASPQREAGQRAAETLYLRGDPTPLGDFIEAGYFRVLSNRDYP